MEAFQTAEAALKKAVFMVYSVGIIYVILKGKFYMENTHLFRVAILQKHSYGRDYDANTRLIIDEMKRAAKNRADILLIPECFITGYNLPVDNAQAIDETDSHLTQICEAAARFGIGIVATALTKGAHKPQNSAYVIDKNGKILMKYSKVHTCDFADEAGLESGDEFKVCSFDGVKLGIMICYDREYPESACTDVKRRGNCSFTERLRRHGTAFKSTIYPGV